MAFGPFGINRGRIPAAGGSQYSSAPGGRRSSAPQSPAGQRPAPYAPYAPQQPAQRGNRPPAPSGILSADSYGTSIGEFSGGDPRFGSRVPADPSRSPGAAQPVPWQGQGTPYIVEGPPESHFPAPRGGEGNWAYSSPEARPAPFTQSTAFGGRSFDDPAMAMGQREAFVNNIVNSRSGQARAWGAGEAQAPSRNFGEMFSRAGEMVQQGWRNPLSGGAAAPFGAGPRRGTMPTQRASGLLAYDHPANPRGPNYDPNWVDPYQPGQNDGGPVYYR